MNSDVFDYDIDRYANYARSFPLLNAKDERKLLFSVQNKKLTRKVRENARTRLINHNLRLPISYAFRYKNFNVPVMDLISAGNVGLIKAIDNFRCKNKNRLSTYAVSHIKQSIIATINEYKNAIYIPTNVLADIRHYKKMKDLRMSESDIKCSLNIGKKAFNNIHSANVTFLSLNANLTNKPNDHTTIADVIPDSSSLSPSKIMENEETSKTITDIIKQLKPIHRDIINGRFLSAEKDSLCKLGKKYHCTGENIRQQEKKALRQFQIKLKKLSGASYNDLKRMVLHGN